MDTFRANVTAGFGYDRDSFKTDQASHPFHGSLFFNSARSNGYNFWESGIFAAAGSFVWELGLEKEPPAINDLVNTTLGGMSRGEVLHRLATMLRDNTATGSGRFWRELGAGVMDPAGFLTRLTRGELKGTGPNPDDRLPGAFRLDGDLGYRHVGGDASNPDQGLLSLSLLYGDPFAGATQKPFDSFTARARHLRARDAAHDALRTARHPHGPGARDASASARHILGRLHGVRIHRQPGAGPRSADLQRRPALALRILKSGFSLSTSVTGMVAPLAGVGTTNFLNPLSGRSFDYGPGGGFRAGGAAVPAGTGAPFGGVRRRLVPHARRLVGQQHAAVLPRDRALAARRKLGVGAGYSWYSRHSTYTGFFEGTKTQSEWRAFVSWNLL